MQSLDTTPLFDLPVVVLDTETTGLHPGLGDRLVEVGAVRLENGRYARHFTRLINPQRPISAQSSRIIGLTDADVADAPPFAAVWPELRQFIDGAVLVAHKAEFDAAFLSLEISLAEPNTPADQIVLPNPWLCTLRLARRHFNFYRNNLGFLARRLNVRPQRAHRALNDVYMTAEVLQAMMRRLSQDWRFRTVGDLIWAQGQPIYTPPPFNVPIPPEIETAVHEQAPLNILHIGPDGPETMTAVPLYPTEHRGIAYIIVRPVGGSEVRPLPLDRIFGVEPG